MILEALANETNGEYWYIAPTYRQAKNIAWKMLKNVWYELPEVIRGEKNEAELWVEVRKSRIALKGADNEDSLRGSGLHGIIFDEVASYRNWAYLWEEVMRPALSDYRGFAWFISTPQGFNHFYDLAQFENKDRDFISFHFTSFDNPFLAREEIEKAKIELTEDAFAQEYLADFRRYTGLIYKEFDRKIHVIEPFEVPNFWQFYRAMDFGAINPTVCLWLAVDTQDNVYIIDEYYHVSQTSKLHAEVIKAKTNYPIIATWCDPSAEQAQLDYAQYGLLLTSAIRFAEAGQGWVKAGIDKVSELLKVNPQTNKPRLFVFKNCVNTIKEFEYYHWLEKKGEPDARELPEKLGDHCMDALRYFSVSYAKTPQLTEEVYVPTNKFTGY